jgi:hypothetical protein
MHTNFSFCCSKARVGFGFAQISFDHMENLTRFVLMFKLLGMLIGHKCQLTTQKLL